MNQLRGREWTNFQIEAEIEYYYTYRIVEEHNTLLRKFRKLHELLHRTNCCFVPSNDEACNINSNALKETEEFL